MCVEVLRMPDAGHRFLALTHAGGYVLRSKAPDRGREAAQVIARADPSAGGQTQVALPELAFQEFARVCVDQESALVFAQRFGFLGCGRRRRGSAWPRPGAAPEPEPEPEEDVADWLMHAQGLREGIATWRELQGEEAVRKARRAPSGKASGIEAPPKYLSGILDATGSPSILVFEDWKRRGSPKGELGDDFGWALLGDFVTNRLSRLRVIPALIPGRTSPRGPTGHQELVFTLAARTYTLIGALWLQFAFALTLGYRFCEGCGILMAVHPDLHRKDQKTCRPACRTRASRAKAAASSKGTTSPTKRRAKGSSGKGKGQT
jgi:hypothetical protein